MEAQQKASTPANAVLPMVGGVKIDVPRQIRHLSTFVLQEQLDWFEDEIKFLRVLLQPGMKIIDIGANYGLYTMSMAKTIGDGGAIWAFEPASQTLTHLRRSVAENDFDHVTVIGKGLSDREGEATFHIAPNSELNSLHAVNKEVATETISLTTLDNCADEFGWMDIDFIKLDAEGEESRIIQAGSKMLESMSPLIMFELKHAKQINLPLIKQLSSIGYESYRLIPGLNIMMPFDDSLRPDPYQLNLFCCKADRAEALEKQGLLVRELEGVNIDVLGRSRNYLSRLPFTEKVGNADDWSDSAPTPIENLLDFYIAAQDKSISPGQRVACLRRAIVLSVVQTSKGGKQDVLPIEQVATHARIALDGGQRNRAVQLMLDAIGSNDGVTRLEPKMPFLPASKRYDRINPADRLNRWLVSSVVEQWVINHAYSSYFTVHKALPALKRLSTLGFQDSNLRRRLALVSSIKLK